MSELEQELLQSADTTQEGATQEAENNGLSDESYQKTTAFNWSEYGIDETQDKRFSSLFPTPKGLS